MLAGVDIGSTGIKVSVFKENGQRIAYAYREYSLEYLGGDRVVIDPELWWDSLLSCLRELRSMDALNGITAIGLSHANSMVLADEHYKPVYKAVMQLDKRGAGEVSAIRKDLGADRVLSITGNAIREGYTWGPTFKWFQKNEPGILRGVHSVFNPSSYLVMKLTGVYCMDHTRAATTLLYDIEKGAWSEELCSYFGLQPSLMPAIVNSDEVVGRVRGEAVDAGLPEGAFVIAGAMDTVAAMIGLTAGRNDNVLIMGSVGRFALMQERSDPRFLNTVTYNRTARLCMTPVNNAGTAFRWARDLIFSQRADGDNCYPLMNALAEQIPAGSEGLLFLPYLNGTSCPEWDSTVRGSFLNIEAFHGPGHFCRAVMEGVSYALAQNYYILKNGTGIREGELYCGGGGANSTLWMQILSDTIDCRLHIPENLETETMGCAMLAGLGTGELDHQDLAVWNSLKTTLSPDPARRDFYREQLRKFIACMKTAKDISDIFLP